MIRVGIIGCGKIAQTRHIPEYAAHPDAVLAGFYDLNQERAQELAQRYQGKAYPSVEALLADDSIDAVSVCTANNAHASISIAALRAGKHVLCEKPMATTLADCERMVAEAARAHRFLMIGQNQRLAPAHVRARELLARGEIGTILTARTTFGHGGPESWSIDPGNGTWFFDPQRAAMGVMADLGIHKTDLLQFLCGGTICRVTARLATLDKRTPSGELIGVDDNAFCIYEMDNGVMAMLQASWTHYGAEDNSTVLYGTEGMMRIYDDPNYAIVIIKKSGERQLYELGSIQTNDNQSDSGVIAQWVDCLVQGREPELSGQSVLPAMRAVFAAITASREGKTVSLCSGEEELT